MINYSWEVTQLESQLIDGEEVYTHACFDIHGERDGHRGFAQGDVPLDDIPCDCELTLPKAIEWVKAALGERVATYEAMIKEQIERISKPAPKSITPPWKLSEQD